MSEHTTPRTAEQQAAWERVTGDAGTVAEQQRRAESMHRYRSEQPAAAGEVVMQGHADACEAFGHSSWVVDGINQGRCARCGESTEGMAPARPGSTDEVRSFAVCPVCGMTNGWHARSCSEGYPCPALREERHPCPWEDADTDAHRCTRERGHTARHLCACGRQWELTPARSFHSHDPRAEQD